MIENSYKEQFNRLLRYLSRIENKDSNSMEYRDDILAFFQNCWHFKDWLKNDKTVPSNIRNEIESEIRNYNYLMICADLANRYKHYNLQKAKKDADIEGIGVTIHILIPMEIYLSEKNKGKQDIRSEGYSEHYFRIVYNDSNNKKEIDGLYLAKNIVEDWKKVLSSFALPY